jgi:tRNA nucleotidyltransferase (CCA-adding enzyme)
MLSWIPAPVADLLERTPELRHAYLVGGCVRDWLLGRPCHDVDVEVFGASYPQLTAALARWGRVDLVGRSFGVAKLGLGGGLTIDFTVPRRDSKVGPGHRGFEVDWDPALMPADAARRRDFTINALMYDTRERRLLDHVGGQDDLARRVLRHTSPAFAEDPLRVLRGMQFASRFNLRPHPSTVALCRQIQDTFGELARERVREEWFKWAARSEVPSAGLLFLRDTGWLTHFPELHALAGVPQDPEWHPEGDVFIHTCHCCDALAALPEWRAADETSRIVYMLAILAHDFGKAVTTQVGERAGLQRIVSPGHEAAGEPLAEAFLERIDAPAAIRERVVPLVVHHLAHLRPITDRTVRRLARRLKPESIMGLGLIITADHHGRPPLPKLAPPGLLELRTLAAQLAVEASAPAPILLGRHLLEAGMKPSPEVGRLIRDAYEAQLEGHFQDLPGALRWLDERRPTPVPTGDGAPHRA